MNFSKNFIRLNWLIIICIYLVVIAGSFVRITGSGMGCPDWPKCFGEWIPPTNPNQIPENYKEVYSQKRAKKTIRFCKFLSKIGLDETANNVKNDPSLYVEEDFNGKKTWIEYVNRLLGFLAGNLMLLGFFWMLLKYRKKKLIGIQLLNLILMGIQGWFGSIVVATNLVPWTITVHLFLALLIIGIQLKILFSISKKSRFLVDLPKGIKISLFLVLLITFYQMFLGTQVRESIDLLTKEGYGRDSWTQMLGIPFYIHRSFSWLVLIGMGVLFYINEKKYRLKSIRNCFLVLCLGLITGVLLAHIDMPGLVQVCHLVFAVVLFGQLLWLHFEIHLRNS